MTASTQSIRLLNQWWLDAIRCCQPKLKNEILESMHGNKLKIVPLNVSWKTEKSFSLFKSNKMVSLDFSLKWENEIDKYNLNFNN